MNNIFSKIVSHIKSIRKPKDEQTVSFQELLDEPKPHIKYPSGPEYDQELEDRWWQAIR